MKPEEVLDNINNKIIIQGRRNGKYIEREMMKVIIEALEKQVAHDPQIETPTRTGTYLVKDRDGNYRDADWLDCRFWLKRHVSGLYEPVLIQSIVAWWHLPDAKVKKIDRGEEE